MSAQRLSDKNVRKWARRLDLPIVRMWSHGGYVFDLVTDDHRHGAVDTKTSEVSWDTAERHYTSCHDLFPSWEPQAASR